MDIITKMATRKHISIRDEQAEWVDDQNINLSRLVQEAIADRRAGE